MPNLSTLKSILTRLHVCHSLSNFHGHGTRLRVWHEATRSENSAQRTHFAHDLGSGNDYIHIGPSALDLRHVFVQPNVVGTGVLSPPALCQECKAPIHVRSCPSREGGSPFHEPFGSLYEGLRQGAQRGLLLHRIWWSSTPSRGQRLLPSCRAFPYRSFQRPLSGSLLVVPCCAVCDLEGRFTNDVDAHASCRSGHHFHGGLDGEAIQIGHLVFCNCSHLVPSDFAHLAPVGF